VQLGRNFRLAAQVWMDGAIEHGDVAYPVAAATACARLGIARDMALTAFIQGFCAAQVSVAVRLVPLGQTDGLRVLKALAPVIAATAARAGTATRDDLGSVTLAAEFAAMRHETLEPRIFRT
jgi:urease accessory protein